MAKRNLSEQEKRLWQFYTRDIKQIGRPNLPAEEKKGRFEIKIPKNSVFQKTSGPNLSNYESLENRDSNWTRKLKGGKARPEGKIDLHGMTCVQAHEKLYHYLERAQKKAKRVVLVVTGKGGPKDGYADYRYSDFDSSRGVLKREVPLWLSGGAMRHMIVSFEEASRKDGGSGALYVILKRIQ